MFQVKVVVEGVSVWVDRGFWIEVLFPVGNVGDAHIPLLTATVGSTELASGIDLSESKVPLLDLARGHPDVISADWMLPVEVDERAPIWAPLIADDVSLVRASIALPKALLRPLSAKRAGPFRFQATDHWLDYGTVWESRVEERDLVIPMWRQASVSKSNEVVVSRQVVENDARRLLTITVANRTAREHIKPTAAKMTKDDKLKDVSDALVLLGLEPNNETLPTFLGEDAGRATTLGWPRVEHPERPCPGIRPRLRTK